MQAVLAGLPQELSFVNRVKVLGQPIVGPGEAFLDVCTRTAVLPRANKSQEVHGLTTPDNAGRAIVEVCTSDIALNTLLRVAAGYKDWDSDASVRSTRSDHR